MIKRKRRKTVILEMLVFSITAWVIMLALIVLGSGTLGTFVRADELLETDSMIEENNQLRAQVRQYIEQLQIMDQRITELEEILLRLEQTNRSVNHTAAPSRAQTQEHTGTTMPVLSISGYSAGMLEKAFVSLSATGMVGTGWAFIQAEQEFGVNALALAAIAHLESAGGNSSLAQNRNNLMGLKGMSFDNKSDSIMYAAKLLAEHYLTPGGKYYHGSNLEAINVRYAEDPKWASKAARRMKDMAQACGS